MHTLPPALGAKRRHPRAMASSLLLVAVLLAAGPAQALSLELLLRMPLERLLQLPFSPATAARESLRPAAGGPHAR